MQNFIEVSPQLSPCQAGWKTKKSNYHEFIVHFRCNGENKCSMYSTDLDLGPYPCQGTDNELYLEAHYKCISPNAEEDTNKGESITYDFLSLFHVRLS